MRLVSVLTLASVDMCRKIASSRLGRLVKPGENKGELEVDGHTRVDHQECV